MRKKNHKNNFHKLSAIGLIVTLGIVYGDIGTSPLYVMKAILSAASVVDEKYILGALSCIIWTLTLQTTIKYVIITLRADNNGEGGILALYALVKRSKKRIIFLFAIIGASTLIADGIITPSITVTSAVEGLQLINPDLPIIPIVLGILIFLFTIQQFGTNFIGKSFGPMMLIWFLTLAVLGVSQIIYFPAIFKALNPYYAINLLIAYPKGFLILGAVFLCTTGAEALYTDLGHCGIKNIRISWIFVKLSLILNYLGQGAWVLNNLTELKSEINPYFEIMPQWFIIPGVILSTIAAIIASQALISGSYTLFSEAMSLNFWPRQKVHHPTHIKGQMYIPFVNWFLLISCIFIVLYFKKSSSMEAAYGLSITITMLMTTMLLVNYLRLKNISKVVILLFVIVYVTIEGSFFIANMFKFLHGGWVTIFIASIIGIIMFVWYKGRLIKNRNIDFTKIEDYYPIIKDINADNEIPKYATNLVYLSKANHFDEIETKILFSIINKQPKRADYYWIIHVHTVNHPNTLDYSCNQLIPNVLYKLEFRIGFKRQPLINLYLRQVIEDLVKNNEYDLISNYPSLRKHGIGGDFRFVLIHRIHNYDFEFSFRYKLVMNLYNLFARLGISDIRAFGLDTSNVVEELVPLIVKQKIHSSMVRREDVNNINKNE
jgi:KUP system potassium uptake protein